MNFFNKINHVLIVDTKSAPVRLSNFSGGCLLVILLPAKRVSRDCISHCMSAIEAHLHYVASTGPLK